MIISNSINEKYIRTLTFNCFPKNVLEFQESQDYFQQLIFIDYQTQLIIKEQQLPNDLTIVETDIGKKKLVQLIEYTESITLNYENTDKSYDEMLYYVVVLGHLYYLTGKLELMADILNSIVVKYQLDLSKVTTDLQGEFVKCLHCKYHVLLGLVNTENGFVIWREYLNHFKVPFTKSQVSGVHWLDLLDLKLAHSLSLTKTISFDFESAETSNEIKPISFDDIKELTFFINSKISTIQFCNFLIRGRTQQTENNFEIDSQFKLEYIQYLILEIESNIKAKVSFPNALANDDTINNYINNLYESLSYVPYNLSLVKPTLSKRYLIDATSKTYQSKVVLSNLIYTLIDLNEYDEAFVAFETYIEYLTKDEQLSGGHVNDILSIIDTFSTCIIHFNPLKSFKEGKFKYTKDSMVISKLKEFIQGLTKYLDKLQEFIDLTYDTDSEADKNPLSFLYRKYNANILQSDNSSQLIELISKAWYSIGYYYSFLSMYESVDESNMQENVAQILRNYKNSLIVNSTGNILYLFNYAMSLANSQLNKSALKLCKFILKKYPDSFKTWNLLVLLLTSFEIDNSETIDSEKLRDSEDFINKALNIAGLFILNHQEQNVKLTFIEKTDILQLKLTQLAVIESIYGINHMMEYLNEVFILYHELFGVDLDLPSVKPEHPTSSRQLGISSEERWSHRPSFIDPSMPKLEPTKSRKSPILAPMNQAKTQTVDKIKRLSKIGRTPTKQGTSSGSSTKRKTDNIKDRKLLQSIWLWTCRVFIRAGLEDEAEQCIVEAETIYTPNIKTYTALGFLTSKTRKFLALQEYERSLELIDKYNKQDLGWTLLGMAKLIFIDDITENSLFISEKDLNGGIIRMKNLLENFTLCWPYGRNNSEIWFYLCKIYEIIDDKIMLNKSLWKCIELEDIRPVRSFNSIEWELTS
ncbi:Cargo-transport protein YPP1 [Spathaspora sp. JA1]|nr:Cargo-transport protein YPP1 [Spathaspora sp. JA1]